MLLTLRCPQPTPTSFQYWPTAMSITILCRQNCRCTLHTLYTVQKGMAAVAGLSLTVHCGHCTKGMEAASFDPGQGRYRPTHVHTGPHLYRPTKGAAIQYLAQPFCCSTQPHSLPHSRALTRHSRCQAFPRPSPGGAPTRGSRLPLDEPGVGLASGLGRLGTRPNLNP